MTLDASGHHLAKVMQRLVRVGLVNSTRGPQGGFLLAEPAASVSLLDVFEAVEGPVDETACITEAPPCRGLGCILGKAVQSIEGQLRDYLKKTTLADLADSLHITVVIQQPNSGS